MYMSTLNTPNRILIKDMTSMETTLLYYLFKSDVFRGHLVKLSFSEFYLKAFGEIYKAGNSRKMQIDFNNAIDHFERLGLVSMVSDSHNCKIVDISNLYKSNIASPILLIILNSKCYKIFKDLDVTKYVKLKVFKTYMYILTVDYMVDSDGSEYLPDKLACKDLGLSYNTYHKYLKYLKDMKLINIDE